MAKQMTTSEMASVGGKTAAANMTPEERKARAQKAAESRWSTKLPRATHSGILKIANREIVCAVLEDDRRVLNQETFLMAIGRNPKAKAGTGSTRLDRIDDLPPFLSPKNLKPFISNELKESTNPIIYLTEGGGRAYGYLATLLPGVCRVYMDADRAGALRANQLHIVDACRILHESLADVAIIALVDEATGYQYERPRLALQEFLAMYINKKLAAWEPTFPAKFYSEVYRLKGWEYDPECSQRIPYVGKITNDLVYSRLAPFVLEELKKVTPKDNKGRRKHKFFQRLTKDHGIPELRDHFKTLFAVTAGYEDGNWQSFYRHVNRALPPQPQSPDLFSCFPELLEDDSSTARPLLSSRSPLSLPG